MEIENGWKNETQLIEDQFWTSS